MRGLVTVTLAVIGLLAVSSFDLRHPVRHQQKKDADRDPNCYYDQTYMLNFTENGAMGYVPAVCNCSYITDIKDYQVGSSLSISWFQNNTCANISFVDQMVGSTTRKAWEIGCKCKTYTPASSNDCEFSTIQGRWTRCFLGPNLGGSQYDDTFCSEIEYDDGTIGKTSVWCMIPGSYDWLG